MWERFSVAPFEARSEIIVHFVADVCEQMYASAGCAAALGPGLHFTVDSAGFEPVVH
jgi:hypothetical protein